MNFITLSFVFFFFFVLAMSALCRRGSLPYTLFLLAFNIIFYSFAGTAFLPLLFFVAFINWLCAKLLFNKKYQQKMRTCIISLTVTLNVFLLAFYKYYEFFLLNVEALFNSFGASSPFFDLINEASVLTLPIGLSFYIFQGLSYAIDAYRATQNLPHLSQKKAVNHQKNKAIQHNTQEISAPESFFHVLLFVSFFPTILAGPLLRAQDFFTQLRGEKIDPRTALSTSGHFVRSAIYDFEKQSEFKGISSPLRLNVLTEKTRINRETCIAFTFILSGLFKKVVLASYLSEHIVRDVFQSPEFYSSPTILMAVYAYAMQIYCDFSGYSDIAIGIGALMGYHLPQNFNAPYLASSLQDFWRRWHITLSTWLRDYLYIPLGGSRSGNRSLNLIITMTLGGLWHGSHLHYLIWGFMHGIGLSVVHAWKSLFALFSSRKNNTYTVSAKQTHDTMEEEIEIPEENIARASHKTKKKQTKSQKHHAQKSHNIAPLVLPQAPELPSFFARIFKPFRFMGAWFLTFHFVCLLWIFFRATDTESALYMIERIAFFNTQGDGFDALVPLVILVSFLMQLVGPYIFRFHVFALQKLWAPLQVILITIFCAIILKLGPDGVMPFIYFQF